MKRRTERIELRLTPEESQFIKDKASSFQSISQYIRMAVREYCGADNVGSRIITVSTRGLLKQVVSGRAVDIVHIRQQR